jgi:iron complex outermembrane receptor protein
MPHAKTVATATALLCAFGGVGLGRPAAAQQPDSAQRADSGPSVAALKQLSVEQLMNVEVMSVSKRVERLSQAASAIQVITQEMIRRSGASSLPEALRLATNLQVAQLDARQWAISARGFTSTAANKLLVLIDGRTVYTPLYSGVFWDVQDVSLADIDRIEVISGPGATLWGSNAVNGVINVLTKHARDTQGLSLVGGGGSTLRGFGAARYGGTLGSDVHYRIYGKGFTREPSMLPTGADAGDSWHVGQGGFRLDWEASAANRVTLQGDLYDGRAAQQPTAARPAPSDIAMSGGNVVAKWSHTVSPTANVSAQLYYDRTHRDVPGTFGEDLDIYDVDVQHRARLGARHDVVWGLGYRLINDRVTNSAALAFLPPQVARQWFTAFLQDEITLVPERLQLALGTKVEHNDYTGFEVQPSGRMNWTLTPSTTLWAAVSRALRTPSRIDRELFAPAQPPYILVGGPMFHSEEELAYELGYRHLARALGVSVATFYSHYHGLRSLEETNPPQAFPIVIGNGQDGEAYGAELTGDYRATDRWTLRAGYTELRVHIWAVPGSTDRSSGSGESHDPERQFTVASSLTLPAALRLDGVLRYVGELANQQVPAYTELNARLTWQPTTALGLSLVGQNLLHDHHAEFGALGTAAVPTRWEIRRGVFGSVTWQF